MPTLHAPHRMLSSDIKPLKAGLQEKTQSSLILCVTWHLFGAAFLLHRVWGGIQIEGLGRWRRRWGWGKVGAGRAAPVKMALQGRSIDCHTRRRRRHPGEAAAAVGRKANPYVRETEKKKKKKRLARLQLGRLLLAITSRSAAALMRDYEVLISPSAQVADHLQC